jgi:hypothetical protein
LVGSQHLVFVGPIQTAQLLADIEALQPSPSLDIWVTAGCFNAIVVVDAVAAESFLERWFRKLQDQGTPHEQWVLSDGLITSQAHFALPPADDRDILSELGELGERYDNPAVHTTLQENLVVTATTLARLAIMHPPLHAELRAVAEDMRDTLVDHANRKISVLQLQSTLLSANAALSRFSSQALSGTPPLEATECHFWIHSLLGTGSANIALATLVSSIQQIMGEARIPERLAALEKRTVGIPDLDDLTSGTSLLKYDILKETALPDSHKPIVPLVCYFSGRDGFSSQVKSLSAPLTTLAECNSMRSSLLTVTHEISHIFVQAVLRVLMPALDDKDAIGQACRLVTKQYRCRNYLEAIQRLLLEAVVGMEFVSRDMHMGDDEIAPSMPEMLERWRHELQEIIVHTFDFLYFYAGKPDFYIRGIWHSWCAIPGIGDRVPEYLMRTLCAVSANLLDVKPEIRFRAALNHVQKVLAQVSPEIGHSPNYVEQVLRHIAKLEEDNAAFQRTEQEYSLRLYLTRLVTIFLFSEELSNRVFKDPHPVGGEGYAAKKPFHYDFIPIGNPLRFLKEHQKESPSEAESLWVLHCIAFDTSLSKGIST